VLEQCVILLGGLGTRLGDLTKALPKPLLPVGESPFVEVLVSEAWRRGFRKYLLLAGHRAEAVSDYLYANDVCNRFGATIELSIEPIPLGTGGALVHALDRLDGEFLLLNGDTWFDFNWMDFVARSRAEGRSGGVALRSVVSPDRYETVEVDGVRVSTIRPRGSSLEQAFINGGVYHLKRRSLEGLHQPSSLEADLLPRLIREGQLSGFAYSGFFIDIGTPESYAAAQTTVPARRRRPAVFFDRDGVLNIDKGYVHSPSQFEWVIGAKETVKLFNDAGYYVFVVTNQSGIARGFYDDNQAHALHAWINDALREEGAYVDDWRYCPFHPEGVVEKYRGTHAWRKPGPGMIRDLIETWPVEREGSLLIGDKESDIAAAEAVGITGYLLTTDNLLSFVMSAGVSPARI